MANLSVSLIPPTLKMVWLFRDRLTFEGHDGDRTAVMEQAGSGWSR